MRGDWIYLLPTGAVLLLAILLPTMCEHSPYEECDLPDGTRDPLCVEHLRQMRGW